MHIRYIRHAGAEGPGMIAQWAYERGHPMSGTNAFAGERLPAVDEFDWLVLMGGAMSANDEADLPWLAPEKALIRDAIESGKRVLGICLGAQLIASALGARVYPNRHKEIGWFEVSLTDAGSSSPPFAGFPQTFPAFQWHGETFDIPGGAVHAATGDVCVNQALTIGGRVAGLQFHLEVARGDVELFVAADGGVELVEGKYIRHPEAMLAPDAPFDRARELLWKLLDNMAGSR